ncbi:MAG: hypothetical protein ABW318_22325 [Vicinamibacterales bacterium]
MGGASLSGLFGGPSTLGSNLSAPANTTPTVMGAQGKLEAFNPATMAGTYNSFAPTPTMQNFTAAGMDAATGLPSYVTNFLQQGGTGTLKPPQFTMDPGTGVEAAGAAGSQVMKKAAIPIAPGGVPKKTTTTATAGATSSTPGQSATGIQPVNTNWQQTSPLIVNDQWGGGPGQSSGTSQQVATPALGSPTNPFASLIQPNGMMPQFFTDGNGNYFSDAQGKVPVPANVAQILKAGGV